MDPKNDAYVLKLLQAKAIATSQAIERMPDANKTAGGRLNGEFGEDYNMLLDSVRRAAPTLAKFLPPRATVLIQEQAYPYLFTRGVEIACYCMQINAMLMVAINQLERVNVSERR